MTYATVLAGVGALLLSTPVFAAPSHGQTIAVWRMATNNHSNPVSGDQDRDATARLLDQEMTGILHNPHCDPDDKSGPDGDHDDKAANNPGRGRHVGRCIGRPATP